MPPWWKGARGEWYVVGQFVLGGLILLGPRQVAGWPAGRLPGWPAIRPLGAALTVAGSAIFVVGIAWHGRRIATLPRPPEGAPLIRTGPYRVVRHPIYSGLLLAALGWSLLLGSGLTLLLSAAAAVLHDAKSRLEEHWLLLKFPEYREYQRRVRRFIPFVYVALLSCAKAVLP